MGQPASSPQFSSVRLVIEHDCLRGKVLAIRPPRALIKSELPKVHNTGNFFVSNTRLFRSVICSVVGWNGTPLLPEQWLEVLGHHRVILYFFSDRDNELEHDEVLKMFHFCLDEAHKSSNEARVIVVKWKGAVNEDPTEQTPPKATTADKEEAVEDGEDSTAEQPQATNIESIIASRRDQISLVVSVESKKDVFDLKCVVSSLVTPMELSRPLCSLLFQLHTACNAAESYILAAGTLLPLMSTLDDDVAPFRAQVNSVCSSLCTYLTHNDVKFVSMTFYNFTICIGWAVQPYAFVFLLLNSDVGLKPPLVERNIEYFGSHFFNVVHHTSFTRRHNPMGF